MNESGTVVKSVSEDRISSKDHLSTNIGLSAPNAIFLPGSLS
jgi:hypothetical protein